MSILPENAPKILFHFSRKHIQLFIALEEGKTILNDENFSSLWMDDNFGNILLVFDKVSILNLVIK